MSGCWKVPYYCDNKLPTASSFHFATKESRVRLQNIKLFLSAPYLLIASNVTWESMTVRTPPTPGSCFYFFYIKYFFSIKLWSFTAYMVYLKFYEVWLDQKTIHLMVRLKWLEFQQDTWKFDKTNFHNLQISTYLGKNGIFITTPVVGLILNEHKELNMIRKNTSQYKSTKHDTNWKIADMDNTGTKKNEDIMKRFLFGRVPLLITLICANSFWKIAQVVMVCMFIFAVVFNMLIIIGWVNPLRQCKVKKKNFSWLGVALYQ